MSDNYTAVIIDDETLAREITKKYLDGHKQISDSAECSNGFDAIKKINELTPDLIFLDIQMPKLNGFEMLELLENPPVIIFTTAFDQFALKAFEGELIECCCKNNDRGIFEKFEHFETIKFRHLDIEEDKVGVQFIYFFDSVEAIRTFGGDRNFIMECQIFFCYFTSKGFIRQ